MSAGQIFIPQEPDLSMKLEEREKEWAALANFKIQSFVGFKQKLWRYNTGKKKKKGLFKSCIE